MKTGLKSILIVSLITLTLAIGSKSAFALSFAEGIFKFKILNHDELPILWGTDGTGVHSSMGPIDMEGTLGGHKSNTNNHYQEPVGGVFPGYQREGIDSSVWGSINAKNWGEIEFTSHAELNTSREARSSASIISVGWHYGTPMGFVAQETGVMTLEIEYSYMADLSADYAGEYASVDLDYVFNLMNYSGEYTDDSVYFDIELEGPMNKSYYESGILQLSVFFNEGDLGQMDWLIDSGSNVSADGSQPVPEPATMLLLSTGLAGLVSVGRKKIRK